VLRAHGLTPGQLWRLVLGQSALIGLTAGGLALPVGLSLAYIMVKIINRRSFGWSLPFLVPPHVLAEALALALGAALLAGLYPAWRTARSRPADALREE
jgi:putative ABC transport system permease protein